MASASYLAGLGASPGSLVLKTGSYSRPILSLRLGLVYKITAFTLKIAWLAIRKPGVLIR